MGDETTYSVVILTARHSISGELRLYDQRLSDHLNDRRDTTITLRDTQIARLTDPGKVIAKNDMAVIPKAWIVVAFEPPQKAIPPAKRFYGYVRKQTHEVFMVLEAMEVRGTLHTTSALDLRRIITNSTEAFLPLTKAAVILGVNDRYVIEQEAVMVNASLIRYIAEGSRPEGL
jgi:hypothetical protein